MSTGSLGTGKEAMGMEKNSWYCCPICGKKLVKLEPGSIMYGVPVYCRNKTCKVSHYPSIWKGRELGDDEPFPLLDKAE